MDVDEEEVEMASCSSSKGDKKRFEVKKVIRSIIMVFRSLSFLFLVMFIKL